MCNAIEQFEECPTLVTETPQEIADQAQGKHDAAAVLQFFATVRPRRKRK